jgi:hypothetical protein
MTQQVSPTKRKVWNVLINKKPRKHYNYTIPFHISGIPCLLGVDDAPIIVQGSYNYNAASDVDYYGYADYEYDVLDRKGYSAAWLERKMTVKDCDRAEEAIAEYLGDKDDF